MRILVYLAGKDGKMYEREIARNARVSPAAAHYMLAKFHKMGLVSREKKGRMVFYERNDESPRMRQLKVFITISDLEPLVEKMKPLSKRVVLFGSCADGTNTEESDIDLFLLSNEKDKTMEILRTNEKIKAIVLNTIEFSELGRKDRPLYERINSGIELWGGETE
ncbi:MAG: nucleotidyltransferase domain-containing protein [Candidatus Micrarchaeota archaeon]